MTEDVRDAVGAGDAVGAAHIGATGGEVVRGAASGRPRLPGWTTRRRLTVGAGIALLVLAVLAGTGTWVLARSGTISDRLVNRSTPALIDSVRLESALVNQETGIRGYGLTGEPSFLDPYTTGLADQRTYTDLLRPLIADDASARRDLDLIGQEVADWQEFLARPVAAAPSGAPVPLATERATAGKTRFDAVRGTLTRFQADLQKTRDDTRADLNRVQRLRDWVFLVIAALIAALAVLVFTGLRRGINRPLERLSADVRTVAMGEFGHTVAASGPADIRQLAIDVEGMRRRLADQLALTDAARARLDQQTVELRRSNAELEQFAYVASHDLQEPLRKVASFCQLLERRYADALDDRARQYIGYAVDGANRMQVLINELLAFSRVGRVHAERRPVDTEALLARTVESLSVAVAESGAALTHDPLPVVDGDPTLLSMLLQNLLSNALKFRSPQRPTRVHVGVRRDDDGMWRLSVADNGIGISPEYAQKIFVIFQRLHTRDEYPGTGIGLALCKKIVEYHGGTIELDPDHRPGTRIVFTLAPAEGAAGAADPDKADQPDKAAASQQKALRKGPPAEQDS